MRVLIALLALGLVCAFAQTPNKPTFANQYKASVVMALPYASIQEPMDVWYDAVNGMQRVDYYGGMDTYMYMVNTNMTYQVMPTGYSVTSCYTIAGPVSLQSIFPDLSQFALQPGTVVVAGLTCYNWQYTSVNGNTTGVYNFYATSDGTPVQYHMLGYDTLLGSHFDEYVVSYNSYAPGPFDNSTFNPPPFECVPFPGGGGPSKHRNGGYPASPLRDISEFHPDTDAHVDGQQEIADAFDDFVDKHGKTYEDETEERTRRHAFRHSLRYVNSRNRAGLPFTLAVNHLADMTSEQRMSRLNSQTPVTENNGAAFIHTPISSPQDLPVSIDWRNATTPVKDQGVCGSCWSFGSAQTIESSLFIKTGVMTPLSSQWLVDCTWAQGNTGCDGGLDYQGYWGIIGAGGIPSEANYPYLMANAYCHKVPFVTDITGFVNVTSGDEFALQDALVQRGPISIAIDASHDDFSFYSSGVYYNPQCGSTVDALDHSVLLVGYGHDATSGMDYWLVKNSWSTHWGDQGYVKMARQNNNCGVETSPTYVLLP